MEPLVRSPVGTLAQCAAVRAARSVTATAAVFAVAVLILVLGSGSGAAPVRAQTPPASPGAWLDAPLQNWNEAGGFVPAAPFVGAFSDPRCRSQERQPMGPEEAQVGNTGWKLIAAWPTQRQGDVAVVMGTGDFDGMCRPVGFNAFVFAGGAFAGTVSPLPMGARSDGSLARPPAILPGGVVDASFVRFAPTDPLCCPSRPQTRLLYRINRAAGAGQPVLVPERPGAPPPAPVGSAPGTAPVIPRLPATGWGTVEVVTGDR
jgi:hypothetical protein